MKTLRLVAVVVLLSGLTAGVAFAESFGFTLTSDNNFGAAVGMGDLFSVTVTGSGTAAIFTFANDTDSTFGGVITSLYWSTTEDDLVASVSFASGTASSGSTGTMDYPSDGTVTPGDMKEVSWLTELGIDPDNPQPKHGIEEGEAGIFNVTVSSGYDVDDVIDAMTSGELIVGFHLQSTQFDGDEGESEWFESGTTPVPEPATLALLGIGLAGVAGVRRRSRKG